jgi:hypothetical protein
MAVVPVVVLAAAAAPSVEGAVIGGLGDPAMIEVQPAQYRN